MRRFVAPCFGLLLSPGVAHAEVPSNSAEALFRAGREAMKGGQFEVACERFNASFELQQAVGTELNLAICEEQLGNLVRAWELLRELDQTLTVDDPRHEIVEERRQALKGRLATLTLHLEKTADPRTAAKNAVSGETLDLGRAVAFMPGEYVIEVSAEGHEPREYQVRLEAAEERSLAIEPGAAAPVEPSPSVAREEHPEPRAALPPQVLEDDVRGEESSGWTRSTWGGLALGVGGAGFVASGVSAILLLRENDVVERECSPATGARECSDKGLDAGKRGRLYSNLGTAGFAVGAVGVGLGAYLVLSEDTSVSAQVGLSPRLAFEKRF